MFDEAVARDMLTLIEGSMIYIAETAPLDPPGTATHHHGEPDHLAYLQRPFLEARDAVHRRMDALGIPPLGGGAGRVGHSGLRRNPAFDTDYREW